jgi:outer membrane protein OmpA-like peptidoglycan-associated protein
MKTEEFDKQFRNKIGDMESIPTDSSWSKEQTWKKLSNAIYNKKPKGFFKYIAASFTLLLLKSQHAFAGASLTAKTVVVVASATLITTTGVIVYYSTENNNDKINEKTTYLAETNENETEVETEITESTEEVITTEEVSNIQKTNEITETNPKIIEQEEVKLIETKTAVEEDVNNPDSEKNIAEYTETVDQSDIEEVRITEEETKKESEIESSLSKSYKIDVKDILFVNNSLEINPISMSELNYLLELLRKFPELKVLAVGYADEKEKSKDKLSNDRGYVIYKYLTKQGIDKSRITYKGYGAITKYSSKTDEGRELNRRVEVYINK